MKNTNNSNFSGWLARNASNKANFIFIGGFAWMGLFFWLHITMYPSNLELLSDPDKGGIFLMFEAFLSGIGALAIAICTQIVLRFILKQLVFKINNPSDYGILETAYDAIYSKRAQRKILEHMYVVNNKGIWSLLNGREDFPDKCFIITRWLARNCFIETERNGIKSIENIFFGKAENEILHKVIADIFFGRLLLNYDEFYERYTTLMLKIEQQSEYNSMVPNIFNTYVRSLIKPTIENMLHLEFDSFVLSPKDHQVSQIGDLYKIIGAARIWEMYDIDTQATYLSLELNQKRLSEMMTHPADIAALKNLLSEVCKLN